MKVSNRIVKTLKVKFKAVISKAWKALDFD